MLPEPPSPLALRRAYLVGAALTLLSIWFHHYPIGTDLPGHAQVFEMLARYGDPKTSYRYYYYLDFFTPYALVYLVAWPLTKLGGALFAVKVILSTAALATPLAFARWLRLIGGEVWLSLFGFVLAFGFPYHWGFISMTLATPISFYYLAAAEELRQRNTLKNVAAAAGLGVLLFFSHGITFGITMLSSGLTCLLQKGIRRIAFSLAHFLPVMAVMVPWYLLHKGQGGGRIDEWPTDQRFIRLLSGSFSGSGDYETALAGFLLVALVVAFGKPVLSLSPGRVVPLALALLGLFGLPEWLLDTWLVGGRFVHYVHCFAIGAFDYRRDQPGLSRFRGLVLGLVALSFVAFNLRMHVFDEEISGFARIKNRVPPGSDVKLFPEQSRSEAFGSAQLGQVTAWIPAGQDGFLENDLGRYFQIPVQRRRDIPWPTEFQFLVVRGNSYQARSTVGNAPELLESAGRFNLFENPRTHLEAPGMKLVRFAQDWHAPRQDRSVDGKPLAVAGRAFATGFGTHARSILEMALASGMRKVRGATGMDDGAPDVGHARFKIMDYTRRVLWTSREHAQGDAPEPFEVSVDGMQGNLFLATEPVDGIANTHTDWLDVRADP